LRLLEGDNSIIEALKNGELGNINMGIPEIHS